MIATDCEVRKDAPTAPPSPPALVFLPLVGQPQRHSPPDVGDRPRSRWLGAPAGEQDGVDREAARLGMMKMEVRARGLQGRGVGLSRAEVAPDLRLSGLSARRAVAAELSSDWWGKTHASKGLRGEMRRWRPGRGVPGSSFADELGRGESFHNCCSVPG